jgi:hypothetical protein
MSLSQVIRLLLSMADHEGHSPVQSTDCLPYFGAGGGNKGNKIDKDNASGYPLMDDRLIYISIS